MTQSVPPPGAFENAPVPTPVQKMPNSDLACIEPTRGADGRFLSGNSGGGRPKGSRNRLTELLMTAIVDDFATHGTTAIARLRDDDPATYLRMVTALVPRELILQREAQPVPDYADLTEEEALALIEKEYRRKRVESSMKAVGETAKR